MQDARALLDSLMGPSRDKSLEEQQQTDGWKARDVCKRYLIGFCPTNVQDNWFHNTRRKDVQPCSKIHSDRLRTDFESHKDRDKYLREYEKEFLDFLEGLVREADAWISRETANCVGPGRVTKLPPVVKAKLVEMQASSELLLKQAEELAEQGSVEASKRAVESSVKLKEDITELKEKHSYDSGGETVCQICGVRCNPDEPADYKAHLDGRLHEGYTKIRAKVRELREKLRQPAETEGGREGRDGRGTGRDRVHERGQDQDRGRREHRDRERRRSRSRGRRK
mmetsp:Transcript_54944/g.154127  ORF Transcript_54944/g.154127 Transcript_54944/m.154127 type:complete len:282 (+) Transcript_54944:115-960(+)